MREERSNAEGGGGAAAGRGHYLSSLFSMQVEKCTYYYLEGTLLYKYFQTEKTHNHNYSKSSKKGSPKYMYLTHHHTIMPPSNHALPNIIPG